MSSKKQTTTNASFNQGGLTAFNNLQSPIQTGLQQNMNNPWQAIAGNQQLAGANQNIFGQSQQLNQGTAQSLTQRGISANSPLFAQQMLQASASGRRQQNGALNNLLLTAGQVSTGGATAASQYQPLQTGATMVQGQSGLGTWLPQVVAAAGQGVKAAAMA